MLSANEIRSRFIQYFEKHGHQAVASSSLVPHNDPTLLFTNAGMNQFKDLFLGAETRDYVRATSSQKCVRAGGKHNDLENVGRTARHHTFFEMLGNFSFGDYFKRDAIRFGWEFLTVEMQLPVEDLWVSVFEDDDEAFNIWRDEIGVREERILRLGAKDNFWAMGDTGPCGPCSEIHIDQGEEMTCGPDCALGVCDCDRFLELWNLVFMQYERDASGTLTPLPKPSIDTGMGLERITAVVQGVKSNYDTDLLRAIIANIEQLAGKTYGDSEEVDVSMRVIADHSRATAFLIADGVLPSNEGRGYVLRRIMRRAARHAKMIGFNEPVLFKTARFVMDLMKDAYPELEQRREYVEKVVKNEEERFIQTLDNGLRILNDEIATLKRQGENIIPGETVFRLYDTFGFPVDLTADIVEGQSFSLDEAGFEQCMERQRQQARENWKGSGEEGIGAVYKKLAEQGVNTEFTGYDKLDDYGTVLALIKDGEVVDSASAGDSVEIVTSSTPFYGESGGQSGDIGSLSADKVKATITDTLKPLPQLLVHVATIDEGVLSVGDAVELHVDIEARMACASNHSATHILQAVLTDVLGDHIKQAGSLVTPDRLRFDFIHFSAMSADEIKTVEDEVNRRIRQNVEVKTKVMDKDSAVECGATALFGEKYGDNVRVVQMGDFSMELCGGTHAGATGNIGLFKIIQEAGIAAGVRRIEATTGVQALQTVQKQEQLIEKLATMVKSDRSQLEGRLKRLVEHQKELEREISTLQDRLGADRAASMMENVQNVGDIKLLAVRIDNLDSKQVREQADKLRDQLQSGVVVLGSVIDGKVALLVAVTKDLTGQVKAGDIIKPLAELVGGRGGGRPDMAQAGGSKPDQLDAALGAAANVLAELK
ncbi:MAG: alanine--tRNA ligase [Desulfobacteraceae bacterium 4572_35.1]|nr:MAG: alanine--tRNA ligase [Desulfobacteraceae bacterium 4572_35.1]